MQIENAFTVSLAPDAALAMLTDVPRIAPCLPGVTLDTVNDDGSYEGKATVRLGPVALSFSGKARIEAIDATAHTARVTAEGADQKGRGRASATVDFAILPHAAGSEVKVVSQINLTGAVAQYGRATGLIKEVANQIIAEFTRNLEAELAASAPADDVATPTATDGAPEPAHAPPQKPAARAPQEIGGFGLLARAVMAWLRGLFGRG